MKLKVKKIQIKLFNSVNYQMNKSKKLMKEYYFNVENVLIIY